LSAALKPLLEEFVSAAEEFGLLLRDKVGKWRRENALATVAKAKDMLEVAPSEKRHAPPRLVMENLNRASWTDNEEVQKMWAGLYARAFPKIPRSHSPLNRA
jgi:hypothetical protein